MKNEPLSALPGRLLIEFDDPEHQRIPDLGIAP
jgi:hypothetical protein